MFQKLNFYPTCNLNKTNDEVQAKSEQTKKRVNEQTTIRTEQLRNGTTEEQRNRGTEEQRNRGTEEQRNRGTEEQRNRGTEEQRNRGTEEQRNRGTEEQRNRGTEEQRNRGTEEQRNRGTEEQRNRGTEETKKRASKRVNYNKVIPVVLYPSPIQQSSARQFLSRSECCPFLARRSKRLCHGQHLHTETVYPSMSSLLSVSHSTSTAPRNLPTKEYINTCRYNSAIIFGNDRDRVFVCDGALINLSERHPGAVKKY